MADRVVHGAIAGASTLLGKELAEELSAAGSLAWDLALLDEGEGGQVTSAGDEAVVIQPIGPDAFEGADIVFFAGDAATAHKYWKEAYDAGAGIVDCSVALAGESGVLVRAPWVEAASAKLPGLATKAVVAAHPAAVMLALVATRLRKKWGDARLIATVMEPASQQGKAGLEELHQQTVGLLSFQPLPQEVYDVQVAFNLTAALGNAARTDLDAIAARIRADFAAIAGDAGNALTLQLLQAPVFNGYTASVFVEVDREANAIELERALAGGMVNIVAADDAGPSNLSATEQGQILVQVRGEAGGRGFWLWMAADNLRLASQNAAACAAELVALRPVGKVQ